MGNRGENNTQGKWSKGLTCAVTCHSACEELVVRAYDLVSLGLFPCEEGFTTKITVQRNGVSVLVLCSIDQFCIVVEI